jgi:hypothetical protein
MFVSDLLIELKITVELKKTDRPWLYSYLSQHDFILVPTLKRIYTL